MINSAIQIAENFMKIALVRKVIEVESDNTMNMRLPFLPIVEVVKVEADGNEIDLADIVINSENLTLTKYVECKKLKVRYVAGYDDPLLIPAPVAQGIMQHISNMYDARGVGAVPIDDVLALYQPYRRMSI